MADTNLKSILSVCATVGSKLSDLTIVDGQLVFVQDRHRIALDFNGKRVFYNQIEEIATEADRKSKRGGFREFTILLLIQLCCGLLTADGCLLLLLQKRLSLSEQSCLNWAVIKHCTSILQEEYLYGIAHREAT